MNLDLEIITPERVLIKDTVEKVIVPTQTGEIAILPNHISLLSQLAPGELTIKKASKEQFIALTGGFLEVANNKVTILANYAIRSDEIELAKAEEAKKRAEKLMQEKTSEQDFAEAEAIFQRAILELKIGTKRRHYRIDQHRE